MRSRLATHGEGRIRVSPYVPRKPVKVDGLVNLRKRLEKHERVEQYHMDRGMSYPQAHKKALKAEHEGLTKKEIFVYEGKLGAIARHKPWNFK